MTIRLTVTAKGQVTLRKDVLKHLGVRPGDKIDVDLLPGGRMEMRGLSGTPIDTVFGMLQRQDQPVHSIDEISAAIEAGWAGRR